MIRRLRERHRAAVERMGVRMHREYQWGVLATYNAERGRGIAHTPAWDALMAGEQERFDRGEPSQIGEYYTTADTTGRFPPL